MYFQKSIKMYLPKFKDTNNVHFISEKIMYNTEKSSEISDWYFF